MRKQTNVVPTFENFRRANSAEYVRGLPAETRRALIKSIRESRPEDCLQCMFFKAGFRDQADSCALGYDSEINVKMRDKLCPVSGKEV